MTKIELRERINAIYDKVRDKALVLRQRPTQSHVVVNGSIVQAVQLSAKYRSFTVFLQDGTRSYYDMTATEIDEHELVKIYNDIMTKL